MDESCTRCGTGIPAGTPYWSLTVQHEAFDGDAIEVMDARALAVLCEACAAKSDFERVTVPEKA